MPCEKCGRRTPRQRLCKQCGQEDQQDERAGGEYDWGTCPECGGLSSSDEVVCADCRSDENEIVTDGGTDKCTSVTDRSDDPHEDDFCVVCGRHPEPGLTMHPVVSVENGTVCEVCTHAL